MFKAFVQDAWFRTFWISLALSSQRLAAGFCRKSDSRAAQYLGAKDSIVGERLELRLMIFAIGQTSHC